MQIKFLGRFHPSNDVHPALPSSPTRARPLPLIDRLAGAINLLHTKSLTWRSHSRGHLNPPHNESQASLLCVQPSKVPHTIRQTLGAHTRGLFLILLTRAQVSLLVFHPNQALSPRAKPLNQVIGMLQELKFRSKKQDSTI